MPNAFVSQLSGNYPIRKFFTPLNLQNLPFPSTKFKYIVSFSGEVLEPGAVLINRNQFLASEFVETRNVTSNFFTNTNCTATLPLREYLFELEIDTTAPTGTVNPNTVGLFIVASTQDAEPNWALEHSGNMSSGTLTFSIPNLNEVNFDWLLRPNEVFFNGSQIALGGTDYSFERDQPVGGSTEITVNGFSGVSDGAVTFRSAGFALAIVDSYTLPVSSSQTVTFAIKSGPFPLENY